MQGYDSSANTWEPKENFVSAKLIDDYHDSLRKQSKNSVSEKMISEYNETPRLKRRHLMVDDLLSPNEIEARNLVPKKVLNIFHMLNNEKELVVLVQFNNNVSREFVSAEWANKHCPQLVIEFYESRIYWRDKR